MTWKTKFQYSTNTKTKLFHLYLPATSTFFPKNQTNNRHDKTRQNAGLYYLSFKSSHHFPFIYSPIKVCLEMITVI